MDLSDRGDSWKSWRARRVSPRAFQVIAAVAVWALVLTIISGAAVRLTGSGLGCPDWPRCTATSVVAPLHFHAWVEFGNRMINAAVSIAAIGALGAAFLRRPRRRDLTLLSAGLLVGLFAEVVLGGLTVQHKLAPGFVMAHFLLAIVFLADAVVLHHRAGLPDPTGLPDHPTTPVRLVSRTPFLLANVLLAVTAVVVTLGTIVTSTGPHGGDPTARRFGFSLHSVAQLHGTTVEVLVGVTIVTMWSLSRTRAPAAVIRRTEIMLVTMVGQAGVGYIQYFNNDPVGLVALHVAGASVLVVATLRFYLGLSAYPAAVDEKPATEVAQPLPAALSTTAP